MGASASRPAPAGSLLVLRPAGGDRPGPGGGESIRSIAARLGRSPSTICRELGRNSDGGGRYRASSAHTQAYERANRPKPAKLVSNRVLLERVRADLAKRYSPEQIAGRLRQDYPDKPGWHLCHETTLL